jgi:hypothetical protein
MDKSWLACSMQAFLAISVQSAKPAANGKSGPLPEEMLQTLLTNKKQGINH